jgi:WD40 repeat protein
MSLKNRIKHSHIFPFLVKMRYLLHRFFLKRNVRKFKLAHGVSIDLIDDGITFFGYYNLSPGNRQGEILFLKVQNEKIRGSLHEPASIMLKSKEGKTTKIAETKAWNWQQDCMLQWMPQNNNLILFNDYDPENDNYITKIINRDGRIVKTYDAPVNNVSKCGKYALTLNYTRLAKMRPDYGYFNKRDKVLPQDKDDGIWKIDFETGDLKLIISLEKLKELAWVQTMTGAEHKVNHIDINPAGSRFMFLHRWIGPQGRFMRLVTANAEGKDLRILNGDIMTSHCCWLNDKEILSFCNHEGKVGYFLFHDNNTSPATFLPNMPNRDGHPSVSPDGQWIITDTYPDKARMSRLYLYHIKTERLKLLGRFYQPLKYKKEMRVDLHPKTSSTRNTIYFESGHKKCRTLYALIFEQLLNE